MPQIQKVRPYLWFNDNAREAVEFYVSLIKGSEITGIHEFDGGAEGTPARVQWLTFTLAGQQFMALNGGPMFQFTPAISLFVDCESQAEVDDLWNRLSEGGQKLSCGWVTDRFGLSWQIIPAVLMDILGDSSSARSKRAMQAMLQMEKIDIAALQKAADSE
jgi:predicted 3-demethylubiquinone-9 3-methyltransferase (glyoxalase superfamily)